jgi:Na+-translocating ferredoxin:NAD+ oxidoreductase RnfD subunit
MVGFSLRFREVIYLIFGAIGVYTYIIRLVFDTFQDTVYFPLLLGGIGVSIIVLAVLYQRYGTRLFRRRS